MVVGSFMVFFISNQIKKRKPVLIVSFVLQILALCLLGLHIQYTGFVMIALFVLGFVATIQVFVIAIARDIYKTNNFGLRGSILNIIAALSGGVMQFVTGSILATFFVSNLALSYTVVFSVYVLLSILAIFTSIFGIKETYHLGNEENEEVV